MQTAPPSSKPSAQQPFQHLALLAAAAHIGRHPHELAGIPDDVWVGIGRAIRLVQSTPRNDVAVTCRHPDPDVRAAARRLRTYAIAAFDNPATWLRRTAGLDGIEAEQLVGHEQIDADATRRAFVAMLAAPLGVSLRHIAGATGQTRWTVAEVEDALGPLRAKREQFMFHVFDSLDAGRTKQETCDIWCSRAGQRAPNGYLNDAWDAANAIVAGEVAS